MGIYVASGAGGVVCAAAPRPGRRPPLVMVLVVQERSPREFERYYLSS
jgi:hypothetical protein